jgi:integrase
MEDQDDTVNSLELSFEEAVARLSPQAALATAQAQEYQDKADAAATRRAYEADAKAYEAWCAAVGFIAFPAAPDVVGAYLASAGEGYAHSTLRRRIAGIARASALRGAPLDTRHPAIRETLRGIATQHGSAQRKSAALTTDEVVRLIAVCADDLTGVRDRALLLVGFAGALRRAELVGLDVSHLTWTEAGVKLLLPRSKGDKLGAGVEVAIARGGGSDTCPVAALQAWLARAAIAGGPIFRMVDRNGKVRAQRLSADAVRRLLLKCAALAGIKAENGEPISPHGLRAGFVTTAYRAGVPDEAIMGHTRHKNLETMRGYVRRAKLATESPSGKLGL